MSQPECVYELTKHPSASRLFRFDFSNYAEIADDGETIASATITITPASGLTLTPSNGTVVGSEVRVQISGGTDGASFLFLCLATTNAGNVLPAKGRLRIRD